MWFRYLLALIIVLIGIAFILMLLAGCSSLKVEGACTYTREIKTHYHCEPGSSLEHHRVAPGHAPE